MAVAIKKTAAIAIAAGLTFAGSAGVALESASTAVAQVNSDPTITGDTGTLTIHKRLNPASTGNPTGNAETNPTGTAVQGVTFKITDLGYNVKNQAAFNEAAKLTAAQAAQRASGPNRTSITQKTDANGEIKLENQAVGVYYVEELATGTPMVDGKAAQGLVPAPGFVVFLPMTNPQDSAAGANDAQARWNYDVHVYPKNTQSKTEKTVVDANKNVGDVVDYAITANIPGKTNNDSLKSFNIVDAYNNAELSAMQVKNVEIISADGKVIETLQGGYALGDEVAYVAPNAGGIENATGSETVNVQRTISFSDLNRLEANRGQRVRVNLTAQLMAIGAGDGDVANRARSYGQIGYGDGTTKTFDTPETKVVTYLGKLLVNKTGDDGKALPGATFELYRCTPGANGAAATLINQDGSAPDQGAKAGALKVNGATSWTTNEQGLITIDGLHVTDIQNSTETIDNSYCLVETKAPAGYELLTQPVVFNLKKDDRKENTVGTTTVTLSKQVDVTNNRSTTLKLPATGGMGILIVVLAGLAIIGGGAYAARRNSAA